MSKKLPRRLVTFMAVVAMLAVGLIWQMTSALSGNKQQNAGEEYIRREK
jgi:hypothetical protein